MQSTNVTGVVVNVVNLQDAVDAIMNAARNKVSLGVALLAVHAMVSALADKDYRYRVNHLRLRLPDGVPVALFANRFGAQHAARIRGHDLMRALARAAASEKMSVYLFGGREVVVNLLKTSLPQDYPGLTIAGVRAGRFTTLTNEENAKTIQDIIESQASLVFVGLGSPRQETWIFENQESLSCPLIGVGAAFDYESKLLKSPPLVVQEIGLEWFWRLCWDPLRLWHRYLFLAPRFFVFAMLQMFGIFEIRDEGTEPLQRINYG